MVKVNTSEAAKELRRLLDHARAGEEVIIVDGDRAFCLLAANDEAAVTHPRPGRGSWKGRIHLSQDFDEPLPDWSGVDPL